MIIRVYIKHLLMVSLLSCMFIPSDTQAQWMTFDRAQLKYFSMQLRSNLTIEQGNGINSFLIATDQKNANRIGFATFLQAGYTFFWDRQMGFHTGLGVRYAHCGFAADGVESQAIGYMTAYNNQNSATRRTHYTATLSSVKEAYNAWFLEIPLQLAYQDHHFWLDAGFKVLLPLSVSATYDYGEASIGAGYAIDGFGVGVEVPVEIERLDAQSGTYDVGTLGGGGIAYPAYLALALSGGYRLALDGQNMLQFGLYLDVALNRTCVGGISDMVAIDGAMPQQRTVLQSNLARSLRYCDFGISVTYNFTFGKKIGYRKDKSNHFRLPKVRKPTKAQVRW